MIPFNRPWSAPGERELLAEALSEPVRSGGGRYTRACQELLERELGCPRAILTTSGTAALELACLLLDLGPGDEVVVPSFTFVSTANAVVLRGAVPIFADIRPDTLNLDERQLPDLIGPRTRAIIPVHYAGVACAMPEILAVATRAGAAVVEDNAHGLFATLGGRQLGTFGCLAALSFHETKNFSCGEGGALLINDQAFAQRAAILRDKGTDRERFLLGQIDRYSWVDVGGSFPPSDLLAAVLLGQLRQRDLVCRLRGARWRAYHQQLAPWAHRHGVRLPTVPADCTSSHHLFQLILPDKQARQRLIAHLAAHGVMAVFHYQPLHDSAMGLRLGGRPGQCPVAEDVAARLLRLPLFNGMTDEEHARVCAAVLSFAP